MAKKVKKIEEVVKEESLKEQPIEETTEAIEEVIETPVEEVADEVVEQPTEAELPKVEFNEEIAPKGYSTIIPHIEDKNPLKMKNGRVYQEVGNGCGMFLDNGAVFRLEEK